MCGICGEYAFNAPPVDPAVITAMRDTLLHRGPDDAGLFVDGPVGLGHRRLSIIDLSPLGRQPMASADGGTTIVFNGEIYNHADIRRELEREGVTFRGGSDTEVAVNAVAVFGLEAALSRFRGMFALALWDARRRCLTLCRDRVGVKPLYYALDGRRLLFGSELRALLAHPAMRPSIDAGSLAGHLTAGFFTGSDTAFSEIRKLTPGTWLRIGPDGAATSHRYWSLANVRRGAFAGTFEEAVEEARSVFREAFRLRLVADVPVGHFLSGGVDSALVAAVIKTDLGVSLDNFTIGFAEAAFDETAPAAALAKKLGLRHFVRTVEQREAWQGLEGFCEIYDEPFGDPSGIPTAILSRFAVSRVKVALSADGGDEQFCGYTGYVRYPALWRRAQMLPSPLRRLLAGCLRGGALGAPLAALGVLGRKPHLVARLDKLASLVAADTPAEVAGLYTQKGFSTREAHALLGLPWSMPKTDVAASDAGEDLADGLMRRDFADWLPEDILLKVDRASMHASLETRDPLLDHRIAELAFSLPLTYLTTGSEQKRLLRRLLADYAGPETAKGPKKGFEIPLYHWLKGPWRPMVEAGLTKERIKAVGILDPDLGAAEATRFFSGQGTDPMRPWLLYNLQAWAERWYTAAGRAS
ncbi:MAG: asparagine synthase (glutamine-hydrolyzing) [Solidesulfovibrio sp.]